MKLSQIYAVMGWPLRFWRTKALPPLPVAHNIPFNEAMRIFGEPMAPKDLIGNIWNWEEARKKDPLQLTGEEKVDIAKRLDAMDARYYSLKQGERKLSADELRELYAMETGHGWCLDLAHPPRHERLGYLLAYLP